MTILERPEGIWGAILLPVKNDKIDWDQPKKDQTRYHYSKLNKYLEKKKYRNQPLFLLRLNLKYIFLLIYLPKKS